MTFDTTRGRADASHRLTVAAEEAVAVVDPLGVSGDLFDLAVITQARDEVVLLELVSTVHAAEEN